MWAEWLTVSGPVHPFQHWSRQANSYHSSSASPSSAHTRSVTTLHHPTDRAAAATADSGGGGGRQLLLLLLLTDNRASAIYALNVEAAPGEACWRPPDT